MSGDWLNRDEAVSLVRRIMAGDSADDEQMAQWFERLKRDLGCPHIADLIFWPKGGEPTAEDVVDQALAYLPIAL